MEEVSSTALAKALAMGTIFRRGLPPHSELQDARVAAVFEAVLWTHKE